MSYSAPLNEQLITLDSNNVARYSDLYKNAYVYSYADDDSDTSKRRLYYMEQDEQKRPVLTDGDQRYYVFRYNKNTGVFQVYGADGNVIDSDVTVAYDGSTYAPEGVTTFEIDDPAVTRRKSLY